MHQAAQVEVAAATMPAAVAAAEVLDQDLTSKTHSFFAFLDFKTIYQMLHLGLSSKILEW